jgi:hypothetical protein
MRDAHIQKRCPLVMGNNSNTILVFRMASKWFAPTIFSTIDGVRVLSVIHSELSRIASELIVIFPPLQVAID